MWLSKQGSILLHLQWLLGYLRSSGRLDSWKYSLDSLFLQSTLVLMNCFVLKVNATLTSTNIGKHVTYYTTLISRPRKTALLWKTAKDSTREKRSDWLDDGELRQQEWTVQHIPDLVPWTNNLKQIQHGHLSCQSRTEQPVSQKLIQRLALVGTKISIPCLGESRIGPNPLYHTMIYQRQSLQQLAKQKTSRTPG